MTDILNRTVTTIVPPKQKTILLIDMDGVIARWYEAVLAELKERCPDEDIPALEDITEYSVLKSFDPKLHSVLEDIMSTEGLYLRLRPYQEALDAMKDMQHECSEWLEPFICTKPPHKYDLHLAHSEKVRWVTTYLGDWWAKKVILTNDKTLVHGDYLIDDIPYLTGANQTPTWRHLLMDRPYNQHIEGTMRFTWDTWEVLKSLIYRNS